MCGGGDYKICNINKFLGLATVLKHAGRKIFSRPRMWGVGALVVMAGKGHSSKDACVSVVTLQPELG